MNINKLKNGQIVTARWGRTGREAPEWNNWQDAELYVQFHNDKICIITLKNEVWAEYSPDDYDDGIFLTEDYYLEIKDEDSNN